MGETVQPDRTTVLEQASHSCTERETRAYGKSFVTRWARERESSRGVLESEGSTKKHRQGGRQTGGTRERAWKWRREKATARKENRKGGGGERGAERRGRKEKQADSCSTNVNAIVVTVAKRSFPVQESMQCGRVLFEFRDCSNRSVRGKSS